MYAALFEMDSIFGPMQFIFQGKDATEIMTAFEDVQDLDCLVGMGRAEEDAAGQLALDKIEEIIIKYQNGCLTVEDLRAFDVRISIGAIKCVCVVESNEAISELKAQYPKAMWRK